MDSFISVVLLSFSIDFLCGGYRQNIKWLDQNTRRKRNLTIPQLEQGAGSAGRIIRPKTFGLQIPNYSDYEPIFNLSTGRVLDINCYRPSDPTCGTVTLKETAHLSIRTKLSIFRRQQKLTPSSPQLFSSLCPGMPIPRLPPLPVGL